MAALSTKIAYATLTVTILIVFPVFAEDLWICLPENRADWHSFGIDNRGFSVFYVVPDIDDTDQRLLQVLITELQNEWLTVSSGPADEIPDEVEIVITYEARWGWDKALKESIIFFRDARTFQVLLIARPMGNPLPGGMPTINVARMVTALNTAEIETPLCWSDVPIGMSDEQPN